VPEVRCRTEPGKARRRSRIQETRRGGATQPGGMQRRPNASEVLGQDTSAWGRFENDPALSAAEGFGCLAGHARIVCLLSRSWPAPLETSDALFSTSIATL